MIYMHLDAYIQLTLATCIISNFSKVVAGKVCIVAAFRHPPYISSTVFCYAAMVNKFCVLSNSMVELLK